MTSDTWEYHPLKLTPSWKGLTQGGRHEKQCSVWTHFIPLRKPSNTEMEASTTLLILKWHTLKVPDHTSHCMIPSLATEIKLGTFQYLNSSCSLPDFTYAIHFFWNALPCLNWVNASLILYYILQCFHFVQFKKQWRDSSGGAVVENPPANAEDMGSSPGLGRSQMPRSN